MRARRSFWALLLVIALAASGLGAYALVSDDDEGGDRDRSSAPLRSACRLSPEILTRIWRGYDPRRSEDVTFVPRYPNYWGSFEVVSHTGPWDYLQEVPLVLYGPGWIKASPAPIERHVTIADVYQTVGTLLDVELPRRDGDQLTEALRDDFNTPPKLIVVLMWDGAGRNMLEQWPRAWPTLARISRQGTTYSDATVGSSPSLTPSTHGNLGTGSFPRSHGIISINYRNDEGEMTGAFKGGDPRDLRLSTFADEFDLARGNEPVIGMVGWQKHEGNVPEGPLAWQSNHLAMLGSGTAIDGGDADLVALIGDEGLISGNETFYSVPGYLRDFPGLDEHLERFDLADGADDGSWLGGEISPTFHDSPGWVPFQTDAVLEMLERERFGEDSVPDIFLTNYKITDTVAHNFALEGRPTELALKAQDDALRELLDYLDRQVRDYVVVVSADHGHTPSPESTGAWPIGGKELETDLDNEFEIPETTSIIREAVQMGLYLQQGKMEKFGVTVDDVASFLNDYTITENWPGETLPDGFAGRGDERVFAAAYPTDEIPRIMECAFGSTSPPAGIKA